MPGCSYVCPHNLLRPRFQPALRAKPGPGFPIRPFKPVPGIARKAGHRAPREPFGNDPLRRRGGFVSAQSPPRLAHAQEPHGLTPAFADIAAPRPVGMRPRQLNRASFVAVMEAANPHQAQEQLYLVNRAAEGLTVLRLRQEGLR
jgi:hypothetical protein